MLRNFLKLFFALWLVGDQTVFAADYSAYPAVTTLAPTDITLWKASGITSKITTPNLAAVMGTSMPNSTLTYGKIQNETGATLLGNPTGSPAAPAEITLGTNLSFSGNVLNAQPPCTTNCTLGGTTALTDVTVAHGVPPHCTSLYAAGNTTITTATGSGGFMVKVLLDTVLNDPDSAADLANHQIIVPSWAHHIRTLAHADFPVQNIGNGYARLHLFRNNTATVEAFYHAGNFYPATSLGQGQGTISYTPVLAESIVAPTTPGETWQLYAWQDTGASVVIGGVSVWMEACFYP